MGFDLYLREHAGPVQRLHFDASEVTFGRVAGNDVVLARGNVSKRHARLVLKDGKYIIVDLVSSNGTFVNGIRIKTPHILATTDRIAIGDFVVTLEPVDADEETQPDPAAVPAPPLRSGWRTAPTAIALDVLNGQALVERCRFSGCATISVGRASDNNVVLDHGAVAARHALLRLHASGISIVDRSGGRGLWVDGRPVAGETELAPGARIAIGPFQLLLGS